PRKRARYTYLTLMNAGDPDTNLSARNLAELTFAECLAAAKIPNTSQIRYAQAAVQLAGEDRDKRFEANLAAARNLNGPQRAEHDQRAVQLAGKDRLKLRKLTGLQPTSPRSSSLRQGPKMQQNGKEERNHHQRREFAVFFDNQRAKEVGAGTRICRS